MAPVYESGFGTADTGLKVRFAGAIPNQRPKNDGRDEELLQYIATISRAFEFEPWAWLAFVSLVVFTRLWSRSLLFGSVRRLQLDDWSMLCFILPCYTIEVVLSNIVSKKQTNLLPSQFSADRFANRFNDERKIGSQLVLVIEHLQILVIWGCKLCLLILYFKIITNGIVGPARRALITIAGYVAASFFVQEILYLGVWCRPFNQYWAVSPDNSQCNRHTNHRIVNFVFNLSTDIAMMSFALTVFVVQSMLPLKRKLVLTIPFGMGIFVIAAAIMNKYFSFTQPDRPTWILWYIREAGTAIIVANLPFMWTLLRRFFNLGSFSGRSHPQYHSARTATGRRPQRSSHNARNSVEMAPYSSHHSDTLDLVEECRGKGHHLEKPKRVHIQPAHAVVGGGRSALDRKLRINVQHPTASGAE